MAHVGCFVFCVVCVVVCDFFSYQTNNTYIVKCQNTHRQKCTAKPPKCQGLRNILML
jgi:hypothetical protein